MRVIPESMDTEVVASIDRRLDVLVADERIRLPWVIESGSRAWSFPSPDSDCDCRFFYVRVMEDYLTPWPRRDVLETPLDEVFDVNGWDLVKALRLLVGGNATIAEWLTSPIIYRGDAEFRDRFLEMTTLAFRPERLRRHYFHLGAKQAFEWQADVPVRLKRIFYALRPAFALQWLRTHGTVPPMDLPTLRQGCECPPGLAAEIDDLLARKAETHELGTGLVPSAIAAYVKGELALASEEPRAQDSLPPETYAELEAFFRWAVERR